MNANDERPQRKGPENLTLGECEEAILYRRRMLLRAVRDGRSEEPWVAEANADIVRLKKWLRELKGTT